MIKTIFPIRMLVDEFKITQEEEVSLYCISQAIFTAHLSKSGLGFAETGNIGSIPIFTKENLKKYPEIKKLYEFFAKSFYSLANEYSPTTMDEIYASMGETTGRLPFMRKGDYKQIHNHSGTSLVAVYYMSDVDNKKEGGKLVLHDPSFNNTIRSRPKPTQEIETKKNRIVIIPGYIWHEVTPYLGEDDRIAVVMNITLPDFEPLDNLDA
ncbi:MAG: putative 2OG-Fe(II) oxygenase [bacterium]|nr:putative 2OG-Fe(II) oxygenase [bacterium]